jgi:hypothetical protein
MERIKQVKFIASAIEKHLATTENSNVETIAKDIKTKLAPIVETGDIDETIVDSVIAITFPNWSGNTTTEMQRTIEKLKKDNSSQKAKIKSLNDDLKSAKSRSSSSSSSYSSSSSSYSGWAGRC